MLGLHSGAQLLIQKIRIRSSGLLGAIQKSGKFINQAENEDTVNTEDSMKRYTEF